MFVLGVLVRCVVSLVCRFCSVVMCVLMFVSLCVSVVCSVGLVFFFWVSSGRLVVILVSVKFSCWVVCI